MCEEGKEEVEEEELDACVKKCFYFYFPR